MFSRQDWLHDFLGPVRNESASPFVKNQTKGLFLFVSAGHSVFAFAILCGFFESRFSWGLGPYCATWHSVVCPTLNSPHIQVTGVEGRSRLEGRAGCRLDCQQSGGRGVGPTGAGAPSPWHTLHCPNGLLTKQIQR